MHPISNNIQHSLSVAATCKDLVALNSHIRPYLHAPKLLNACCALHWAAYCGDTILVQRLIDAGANVFESDPLNGDIPLHYAIKGAQFETLQLIFSHATLVSPLASQMINYQNQRKMTALLIAVAEGSEENIKDLLRICEWLYLQGVSLESQDEFGQTPLLWAAKRGSSALIRWLLARGASMNSRDHVGNTCLHLACMGDDVESVMTLCNAGAIRLVESRSLDDDDPEGRTVYRTCWKMGRYSMCLNLWRWAVQFRYFKFVRIFKSSYAEYYWFLSLTSLALFFYMATFLALKSEEFHNLIVGWSWTWLLTQLLWFFCYFADPGYIKKNVVPSQFQSCKANLSDVLNELPVEWSGPIADLAAAEKEQLRITHQIITLNRIGLCQQLTSEEREQYFSCNSELVAIKEKMTDLLEEVGAARKKELPPAYVDAVSSGTPPPKTVCVTCQIVRPFRAHHCAECGHCIEREDHHCVWVDNCIGKGNQRSFWFFLVFLSTSFFLNYQLTSTFAAMFYSEPLHWVGVMLAVTNGWIVNTTWTLFVIYLLARTTKAMLTNITFLEYLKKPEYIKKRFDGEVEGVLWDFADSSVSSICRNLKNFWCLGDDSLVYDESKRALLADIGGASGTYHLVPTREDNIELAIIPGAR